jgi:hypothetical protein
MVNLSQEHTNPGRGPCMKAKQSNSVLRSHQMSFGDSGKRWRRQKVVVGCGEARFDLMGTASHKFAGVGRHGRQEGPSEKW